MAKTGAVLGFPRSIASPPSQRRPVSETSGSVLRVIRFAVFELDLLAGELRKAGVRLSLPAQSFHVLALLLERPGDLVTREDLRERLWPTGTFVDFEHGLNAVVNRLRDTLGDSADKPRFIETVPRRGYRFIGAIQGPQPHATSLHSAGTSSIQDVGRPRRTWVPWIIAAASCAALIVAALRPSGARPPLSPVPARFEMALAHMDESVDPAEISPDGQRLVFSADSKGHLQLFVYNLTSTSVVALDDTEGAFSP